MPTSLESIGRYNLVRLLGRGGMGEVYLASARGPAGFEKLFALKLLGERFSDDIGRARSLQREALIGVQLDHQNIVQIFDFGEDAGRYYVAMEYVRGFSLGDLIAHSKWAEENLSIRMAVHTIRTIADALHYVHNVSGADGAPLGLFHGDVSPSNILLAEDGRVKLTDFGVSALATEISDTKTLVGKLVYLPPEAFRGAPRTQSWDVYGLGFTLLEALTGERPIAGKKPTAEELAADRVQALVTQARPDCPAALAAVAARAVSGEPAQRYGSAAAFGRALDDAFPRQVDDADHHRARVAEIYASTSFISRYGELPTTGGFGSGEELAPHITRDEVQTRAVRTLPPLRFGMSPALGAEVARKHAKRLAALLRVPLGRELRTVIFADYTTLVDCLVRGEVDLAWMPPIAFADAAERGAGTLVIAERGGRTTFESAIFVRADSEVENLEDLRGETVAWVDRESSSGYLFAAAELARRLGRPDEIFSRQHFHGSHKAVCEAVANGWATAGATYAERGDDESVATTGWLDLIPERADELRAIAFVGPIPSDNIAHRPHLPGSLVKQLVEVFSALSSDEEGRKLLGEMFGADRFVRGNVTVYEEAAEVLASLKRS